MKVYRHRVQVIKVLLVSVQVMNPWSRCTAEYCTDDSGTCTAESGSCFYLAEESRDPDRRGVYEVTARGCTHVNESFFFCAEQENNIGHQVCCLVA